ncbi:hypothetical protein GCM10025857_02190 [Alicyclobacillus contaminans]|nr:hypothetical protein GCM10025857_02190 [Alicyclobacillus contaminans]
MRTNLRDRLQSGWLVGDGAMATLLHQMAVPARTCFEGLCLTKPELVWEVHRAYVAAGAQLIQTNTFSGHRIGLDRYGMSERLADLNRAAVRIAREAVGDADAYVIGTVGSTRDLGVRPGADPVEGAELASVFEEQMTTLLDAGVDGLLLETFADLEELLVAVAVAKRLTDVPIFANLSPDHPGVTRDGCALDDAFRQLRQAGADVVGLNCRLGLAGIVRSYERITLASDLIYSANPNAGRLHYVDGDYSFTADADYFADMMVGLASAGVRVLGGAAAQRRSTFAAWCSDSSRWTPHLLERPLALRSSVHLSL